MKRLLLAAVFIQMTVLPLRAVLMSPLSIEELTKSADVVVRGTVRSTTCQRDLEGRIYTSVELDVQEVWKGSGISNKFTIVHGGGTLGDVRVEGSAQVEYEMGEEVVAFVQLNQRGEGVTLSLIQGKFHVWTDKQTGEKFAHNLFHGTPEPAVNDGKGRAVVADKADARLGIGVLKRRTHGNKP